MTYAIRPDVAAAVTDLYGSSKPEAVFLTDDGCKGYSLCPESDLSVSDKFASDRPSSTNAIDYSAAQASLARLESSSDLDVTPSVFMSVVQGIVDSGFTRQEAVSLIGSFAALRRTREPSVVESATESTMSERSIRRMNYRNACRAKHEEPGYCYLTPIAWKDRTTIAKALGENPTVEQVFNAYSQYFSAMRDWTSYYIIKVSSDDGGKYHITKNSHQSIGTLAGLVNGLKTRWAASGSSMEKFSELPRTVGHSDFVIPLRSRIGYSGFSDTFDGHQLSVDSPVSPFDPDSVHHIAGTTVRTVDSRIVGDVNRSYQPTIPPPSTVIARRDQDCLLSVAHYSDFKTYTFSVQDDVYGYSLPRFLSNISRKDFIENPVVDQLLDNLFAISDAILDLRFPVGKQWLINCNSQLYAALIDIFADTSSGEMLRSSIKILTAIVYDLRGFYSAIDTLNDDWYLSSIGVVVFSKLLSE